MFLRGGAWNGEQLVASEWVEASASGAFESGGPLRDGYLWWVSRRVGQRDHLITAGKHGQYLSLVPDQDLMFVRFGRADPYGRWDALFTDLATRFADLEP